MNKPLCDTMAILLTFAAQSVTAASVGPSSAEPVKTGSVELVAGGNDGNGSLQLTGDYSRYSADVTGAPILSQFAGATFQLRVNHVGSEVALAQAPTFPLITGASFLGGTFLQFYCEVGEQPLEDCLFILGAS